MKMNAGPQYFLFTALRSIIVFQQEWMMVLASALGIGKILFHVDGPGRLALSSNGCLWPFCLFFKFLRFQNSFQSLPPGQ
jgi:hypothetical protein